MYEQNESSIFVYTNTKLEFKLFNILMGVEFAVLDDKLSYSLSEEDKQELDSFIAAKKQKPTKTQKRRSQESASSR